MSTTINVKRTCAVCGKESNQIVLASTNRFGVPDLDLRPPQMMRSTMEWWIQECPYCGYVSDSLDDSTSVEECWLKADAFRDADGLAFESDLAKRFYKHYLISVADGNTKNAFYAALHAAWGCDDVNDNGNAVICRRLALEQLDRLISMITNNDAEEAENDDDEDPTENYRVMRMDLLRRSGQFSQVMEEYAGVEFSSDLLNRIKAFQIVCAQRADTGCYTVADCTG